MKRRHIAAFVLTAVVLGVAAWTAPPVGAQVSTLRSAECPFEAVDFGFFQLIPEDSGWECGYVTVPERHADPTGQTIEIPVAVLRAESGGAEAPLFLAQGGPGGSAFEVFTLLLEGSPVAAGRDIVIFNQRGTTFATPDLSCTESFDIAVELLEADESEADRLAMQAVADCQERLAADGVDLSAFNSVENAADIPLVAEALGYQRIDFYGVSYGTLLGLHLMRDHPDALRSVILDSVVPTQLNFVPDAVASEDRAWTELFSWCASDAQCSVEYPDLEARLFALVERLDDEPITVTVADSDSGQSADTELTGGALLDLLFQLLYVPGNYAFVPHLIADIEDGNTKALEYFWPLLAYDRTFAEGMYYSVICTEDADFEPGDASTEGIRPQLAEGAEDELASLLEVCDVWGVEELGGFVDEPVSSDVPTLVLTGQFDPITPPAYAEAAAATLSNSTLVVNPYGSHGVAFAGGCVDNVITAFLSNPASPPDTSCVDLIGPEELVPADAITMPIVGRFAQLETGFIFQTAAAMLAALFVYTVFPVGFGIGIRQMVKGGSTPKQPVTLDAFGVPVESTLAKPSALVRWPMALGVAAVHAVVATILGVVLGYFLISVAVDRTSYLGAVALPSNASVVIILAFVLAVLAVLVMVIAVLRWRVKGWSVWGKLWYTLVALAAVALSVIVGLQGLYGF